MILRWATVACQVGLVAAGFWLAWRFRLVERMRRRNVTIAVAVLCVGPAAVFLGARFLL